MFTDTQNLLSTNPATRVETNEQFRSQLILGIYSRDCGLALHKPLQIRTSTRVDLGEQETHLQRLFSSLRLSLDSSHLVEIVGCGGGGGVWGGKSVIVWPLAEELFLRLPLCR